MDWSGCLYPLLHPARFRSHEDVLCGVLRSRHSRAVLAWLMDNGLDLPLLIRQAAQLRVGAFAWLDVLVSALVLVGFMIAEGRRLQL